MLLRSFILIFLTGSVNNKAGFAFLLNGHCIYVIDERSDGVLCSTMIQRLVQLHLSTVSGAPLSKPSPKGVSRGHLSHVTFYASLKLEQTQWNNFQSVS